MKENQNRKNWIFALILVLIIVCVLCGILMFELIATKKINPIQNVSLNTEAVAIEDAETEQDMIYFSGFDDITIELGSSIMLPCDTGNKDGSIYMNYTVLDEKGKSLFDSGLIEPGKAVEWFPSLTVGEYDITFHEQPYQLIDKEKDPAEDNLAPLYYVDQTIHLIIK